MRPVCQITSAWCSKRGERLAPPLLPVYILLSSRHAADAPRESLSGTGKIFCPSVSVGRLGRGLTSIPSCHSPLKILPSEKCNVPLPCGTLVVECTCPEYDTCPFVRISMHLSPNTNSLSSHHTSLGLKEDDEEEDVDDLEEMVDEDSRELDDIENDSPAVASVSVDDSEMLGSRLDKHFTFSYLFRRLASVAIKAVEGVGTSFIVSGGELGKQGWQT